MFGGDDQKSAPPPAPIQEVSATSQERVQPGAPSQQAKAAVGQSIASQTPSDTEEGKSLLGR
jgi:hypothetical protein